MRYLACTLLLGCLLTVHAAVEVPSLASAQGLLEQLGIRKNDADVSQVEVAVVSLREDTRIPVAVELIDGAIILLPTAAPTAPIPIGDQGVYAFRSCQINFRFDPTGIPVVAEIIGMDPDLDAQTSLTIDGQAITESVSVAGEGISVSYPLSEAAERDVSMLLDALPGAQSRSELEDDLAAVAAAGGAFGNDSLAGDGFDVDSFLNEPAPIENADPVSPTQP